MTTTLKLVPKTKEKGDARQSRAPGKNAAADAAPVELHGRPRARPRKVQQEPAVRASRATVAGGARRPPIAKLRQLEFTSSGRGGARPGAGRKPKGLVAGVSHGARERMTAKEPVHVTMRLVEGLPSLRREPAHAVVRGAILACAGRHGLRFTHFAILSNHVHLLGEVAHSRALATGMAGLGVRMARGLNALWKRRGTVFADRYHVHVLRTPCEVHRALRYVLSNARHHGLGVKGLDPCSSARWFDGWDRQEARDERVDPHPLPRPRSWLLSVGWRRHGPIEFESTPRAKEHGRA